VIIESLMEFPYEPVFARIRGLLPDDIDLLLKLEGFNPGGSIKLKPAIQLVGDLQSRGALKDDSIIIDTTSGNMGIALALLARSLKCGFICVSDEKMTTHNRRLVQAYGAELVILERSTLDFRYDYIRTRMTQDPRIVWTRQFQNIANPAAHEMITAREVLRSVPRVDHLFAGVGTAGTIVGCARVFAKESPWTCITAVDALGSRHFEDAAVGVDRKIPGIGATQRSPFLDAVNIDRVVIVSDDMAIKHCQLVLQQTGWLLGGSSGSIVSAILSSASHFKPGDTVVGICADFGERYLESVYAAEPSRQLAETVGVA
jgi:N-(2-amino-2-carboxyethyl)-L-glutamate synthase